MKANTMKQYGLGFLLSIAMFLLVACGQPNTVDQPDVADDSVGQVEVPTITVGGEVAEVDLGATAVGIETPAVGVESVPSTPITVEDSNNVATGVNHTEAPAIVNSAPLSVTEIADLMFMREEEKLARDVYLTLYDVWGLPVFQNIASSEQSHMDSLMVLIAQYGLADPAANMDIGQFANAELQTLYNELTTQGRQSLADGLLVGGTIEEIDILDLQERMANSDHEDILFTYQNLLSGSENHLRSFVGMYERQIGQTYAPQYLDQAYYEVIMSGMMGNGSGGNEGGMGNGGGGNGYRGGRGSDTGSQGGQGMGGNGRSG